MAAEQAAPSPEARNAYRVSLVLLLAASLLGGALVIAYLSSPAITGVELSAAMVALLAGLSAVGAWLSYTGRATASGLLLALGLSLLFPLVSALIADLGILLGIALVVIVAAIATLILRERAARSAMFAGIAAAIGALLLDLFLESFGAWPRLTLSETTRRVALPLATGLVALVLTVLVASQFRRYTLSTQMLLGFLALALAPLALVSYLNAQQVHADLEMAANRALLAAAQQTASGLDNFIGSVRNSVSVQGRLPSLPRYLALPPAARRGSALEAQVLYVLGILQDQPTAGGLDPDTPPAMQAYYLLDGAGNLALTTDAEVEDPKFFQGEVFLAPLATGAPYVSPIIFSEAGGPTLFISAPVLDEDNRRVGVIVAQVEAGRLGRVVAQTNTAFGDLNVALFDEYGLRLADSEANRAELWRYAQLPEAGARATLELAGRLPPRTAAQLDSSLPELAARVQAAQQGEPVYFTGSVIENGPPHLAALLPLRTQPWVVMASQPYVAALAPAREQTRNAVLLALAFALPVAALAALATGALTQPITSLTQTAQRVAGGDLAARAEPGATDELRSLTQSFNAMTARLQEAVHTLEERVAERTAQLQATADISRATAGVRDLDELLELAVEMIRARFGFYHASVFLIDEAGEYAVLRESTGELGAQLKAARHKLAIGSRSLVGWVTQNRKLRIARDVADDPFHFKNPLLPETRSELCMPLLVGERLLGVLDVQSRELDAFGASDVQALQVLADQLSIAIENAASFGRTQAALAESRLRYQQSLDTQWRDVLGAGPREAVYDLEPGFAEQPVPSNEPPLQIPLRIRDRVIGAIELHRRGADPLSEAEQAMIAAITAQLATALESAVLVQESQLRGQRERLITEITDEIRSTLNPAFILQSGIRQLGRAVGATEVVVKLQPGERPATRRGER